MLKRGLVIFVFILLIPFVIAESVGVTNYSLPSEDSGCNMGDGCNLKCLDGDVDCRCEDLNGYSCEENQNCESKILKSWEGICCLNPCETIINLEGVSYLFDKNKTIETTEESNYPIITFLVGLIIAVLYFIFLDLYTTKEEVIDLANVELKNLEEKGEVLLKSRFKTSKKKEIKKNLGTLTPLLSNVMETLSKDERKFLIKLIEKEGISKKDLKDLLGFSKEKLDYCLLKLIRRDIIYFKGDELNPKVYIKNWLK